MGQYSRSSSATKVLHGLTCQPMVRVDHQIVVYDARRGRCQGQSNETENVWQHTEDEHKMFEKSFLKGSGWQSGHFRYHEGRIGFGIDWYRRPWVH